LWYLSKIGQKVEEVEKTVDTQKSTSITDTWFVGKKVTLDGEIQATGSSTTYTHTIKTSA
jgi:hypothetical protein